MGFFQQLLGAFSGQNDGQWQLPLVQEICLAMIRLAPPDWPSVYLVLEVTDDGLGSGLAHSAITLERPEGMTVRDSNFVTPDATVMMATRKLELALLERKKTFRRIIISAVQDPNGWDIRSEFE